MVVLNICEVRSMAEVKTLLYTNTPPNIFYRRPVLHCFNPYFYFIVSLSMGSAVVETNEALVFLSLITHIGIVMTTCPGAEMVCSVTVT